MSNPETILFDGAPVNLEQLLEEVRNLRRRDTIPEAEQQKAIRKYCEEQELKPFQAELLEVQRHLEETQQRMIVLFDGRDASGKGGTIKRVIQHMDPRHYRVVSLGKPTVEEQTQWYYQKYVRHFPRGGDIVLFDRSWYNRVLVEQVFGFCTPHQLERFMAGVNRFEEELVQDGTRLIKLYFSVNRADQELRLAKRKADPRRQWKLSAIDLEAQERWDEFTAAKADMLRRTNTAHAPWLVVRSSNKHQARLNTLKVLISAVDCERLDPELDIRPDPEVVLTGTAELALMDEGHSLA